MPIIRFQTALQQIIILNPSAQYFINQPSCMISCEQTFCECDCFPTKTKTQIILYPRPPINKLKNKRAIKMKNMSKTFIKIVNSSHMEESLVSKNQSGQHNSENGDVQDIEHKLKLTIDSITRMGSITSSNWHKKRFVNGLNEDQGSIFEDRFSQATYSKVHKRNHSFASSEQNVIQQEQNKENNPYILIEDNKKIDKKKTKNHAIERLQSTKKLYMNLSPSYSNFQSLNNTTVQHSNRSRLSNKADFTARLLEKQNEQLRSELHRLQLEQKDLLREQIYIKQKNAREYNSLKKKSEELRNRSMQRKSELRELNKLIGIVKRRSNKGEGEDKGRVQG